MNILAKRSLSLLTALVLIVSLFSGVALPASAASYSYNWGTRGVTATYLSSAAQNFYSNTSYEELSSYTGSSNLSSVPSSGLYRHLQSLMSSRQTHETSYAETRDLYRYTDCQGGGGRISSFYSGVEIGPDWDSGATWNREHTWPNSKGDASGNGEDDIMMLRPTAKSENGSRGNKAYGISSSYYDPNMESGYTLNLHGDVARIMLYVYVRWGNTGSMWGSSGVMESREVLLAWMEEDPVDTWELGRNDVTQEITGTRNVFVDYPELAFLMFGEEIPDTMPTPSGMAIAGAHDVTVTTNDATMGTASRSGKTIVAVPAYGHRAVGYEVVSGTAEVTQNGNVFEVKASSDCEIRIIFAPKPVVTLTYLDNGIVLSSGQVFGGDPATLASYTGTAPAGYTFQGWADGAIADTENVPAYYLVGASYTVNGATSLHALFSYTIEGEGGSSTFYTTSPCTHATAAEVEGKDATCDEDGYTAGVYCSDCERFISGGETIGAYGHSYTAVVTPPTVTEDGYTTYTCGSCGDEYTSDIVPALGETYTVTFSVPAGAQPVEDMGCNTAGILLPEAENVEGSIFLGWVTAAVSDTTEAPEYMKAGDKFVATSNTTLYALYTYVEGGSFEGGYVLADSADDLKLGEKVILVASGYDYAMGITQNTNNRAQVAITRNNEGVTFESYAGVAVLELRAGAVDGTYAFYCPTNAGYLYAASSSSNHLKTKADLDANGSFLIAIGENGACDITAQGTNSRNTLRYNSGSSLFACYAATNANMAQVCIYVEAPAGTVYYTTNVTHTHSGTYHAPVAATCQNPGAVEYWSCGCGLSFADSACTKLLNSILVPQLEHSFTAEKAEEAYLKTEANCRSAAVYYLSCAGCGTSSNSDEAVFVYGSVNPDNHPGEGIHNGGTPATCTEPGSTGDVTCGECGAVMVEGTEIPATGHANAKAVPATTSTCSTHGMEFHFYCEDCGGYYLEKGVSAVAQKPEDLQLPLNALIHEEAELRNKADATCEADGYTGDSHCSGCGEKLAEGEVVPGGHNIHEVAAKEPSFEAAGNIAHFACENCGKFYADAEGNTELPEEDVLLEQLVALASVDGVCYGSLEEALDAAEGGATVQLLKDTTGTDVILRRGVGLDLNGNTLEAEYIFSVNGAEIADNSEGNTGLLKVDASRVMISKENAQLPVWNGEGYVFTTVTYKTRLMEHDNDKLKFAFLPQFKPGATALLEDGVDGNKVTIEVRVSWLTKMGREYRNLVFNEQQVDTVVGTNGAFILTFSGFSQLDMASGISVEGIVISETGVSIASEAIVVNVAKEDPLEIVKDAYALAGGEELYYNPVTLTGTISKVNTAWNDQYKNITVTIYIDEDVDKEYPIECFRMVSSGAEMDEAIKALAVNDTITVTGKLMKYQNAETGATKVEFNIPELVAYTDNTPEEPEDPEQEILDTPEKIVNAAYALAEGESLTGTYSLTGEILSVDQAYNPDYENITVTIQVGDMADKPIKCYRLMGEGAAELKRGDIITVTGSLKNHYQTIEFDQGCTFILVEKAPESPEEPDAASVMITFDDEAKRTVCDASQQIWVENGITVTNDKAGSSSDVAAYNNPVRFYKNSKLTVEYAGMKKLEFACGESKYATALMNSISVDGATVTVSGSIVTVELSAAADSFVIEALSGGQVRVASITVTTG